VLTSVQVSRTFNTVIPQVPNLCKYWCEIKPEVNN
jgi:hypothetical protein